MNTKRLQQGMAGMGILAVLMVVALVTAMAVKQSWRSELSLKRSGYRWAGLQAGIYAKGAEQLFGELLEKDLQDSQDGSVDTLTDGWTDVNRYPLILDHATIQVYAEDAQSRINLNALGAPFNTDPSSPDGSTYTDNRRYTTLQKVFIRMLQTIPYGEDGNERLTTEEAKDILAAVKDWVDADNAPSGYGATEQDYYQSLDPPYIMTNGPMVSSSELLRVNGMTPELYRGMQPYIIALGSEPTTLNINTIPQQLLRGFNNPDDLTPLDEETAARIMEELSDSGLGGDPSESEQDLNVRQLKSVDAIKDQSPQFAALFDEELNPDPDGEDSGETKYEGLGVASEWFLMRTTVIMGDTAHKSNSLLQRSGGTARVVRRSDSLF